MNKAIIKFLISTIPFLFGFMSNSYAQWINNWEAEAGLELPFQIGARAKANFNDEFYATAGVGMAMDFLIGINTSMIGGVGIVGEKTAEVVESAIADSFVLDFRGGWNLHSWNGLYLEAGYLFMMGGGKGTDVATLEGAFGQGHHSNPLALSQNSILSLESSVHALSFHAGYRWEISENLILSSDLGLIKPFFSSTTLNLDQVVNNSLYGNLATANQVAAALKSEVEKSMEDVFLSELFIPTFSVWMSYLF